MQFEFLEPCEDTINAEENAGRTPLIQQDQAN